MNLTKRGKNTSEKELNAIRQRKLQELQRRVAPKEPEREIGDVHLILNKIFKGRAWEVFNTACKQFPNEMVKIREALVRLSLDGKVGEMQGEQLYSFLRDVGLPVRLNTTIKITNHGKTESISEKLRKSAK